MGDAAPCSMIYGKDDFQTWNTVTNKDPSIIYNHIDNKKIKEYKLNNIRNEFVKKV